MSLSRSVARRLAGRWPRTAIAGAALLGWLTGPVGRRVRDDEITHFLPGLGPREVRRLQRAIWSRWLRLRVLEAASSSPTARWPYPKLAPGAALPQVDGPAILVSFHLGPIPVSGMLLEQLRPEVLVMKVGRSKRPGLQSVAVGTDDWSRAAAFKCAVQALHRGGVVFVMADANVVPSTIDAWLFGRRVRFARGAFALARLTGAPLVPVAVRWRGVDVEIVAGAPVREQAEADAAAAVAAWLERFVQDAPEEIGTQFVTSFWGEEA